MKPSPIRSCTGNETWEKSGNIFFLTSQGLVFKTNNFDKTLIPKIKYLLYLYNIIRYGYHRIFSEKISIFDHHVRIFTVILNGPKKLELR